MLLNALKKCYVSAFITFYRDPVSFKARKSSIFYKILESHEIIDTAKKAGSHAHTTKCCLLLEIACTVD